MTARPWPERRGLGANGALASVMPAAALLSAAALLLGACSSMGGGATSPPPAGSCAKPGSTASPVESHRPGPAQTSPVVASGAGSASPSGPAAGPPADDPLPPGAVRRLGAQRLWTNGYVYGLAFSADGASLVSLNYLGVVERWDVRSGRRTDRFLPPGADFAKPLALSADGSSVAVGEPEPAPTAKDSGSTSISVWSTSSRRRTRRLRALGTDKPNEMSFGVQGNFAAAGRDGAVRYYGASGATPALVLRGAGGRGGQLFESDRVRLVQDESGVSLSPNGRWLASVHRDGTVRIYSLPKGDQRHTFVGNSHVVTPRFSADSKRVAYWGEGGVRVADLASGVEGPTLPFGDCDAPLDLVLAPDGRHLAAGSDNRAVCLWDLSSPRRPPLVRRVHGGRVEQLAVSTDGTLLASGGRDGAIVLWKLPTLELALPHPRHCGRIDSLAVSGDGKSVATGGVDGVAYLWDLATGRVLFRGENPHRFAKPWSDHSVALSPGGRTLYSATTAGAIRAWDVTTGAEVLHVDAGTASDIALSPDGKTLAFVDSWGALTTYETATGHSVRSFCGQSSYGGFDVAFSPDGKWLASASYDGPLRLWDASSGTLATEQVGQAYDFFFSPDSREIAVRSYTTLTRYALSPTGTLRRLGTEAAPGSVVVAPDGSLEARLVDKAVVEVRGRSSDAAIARFVDRASTENLFVSEMSFTPDGRQLVVGYADGTALVWPVPRR